MKIMLTFGGADIVANAQQETNNAASGFGFSFAGQVRRLLDAHGYQGVLICSNSRGGELQQGKVLSINVPRWGENAQGVGFHLSRIFYGVKLANFARRHKIDIAIIDSGTAHYFSLAAFKLFSIPVAVNFHNVRWPIGFEPTSWVKRTIRRFDSWFFRQVAVGALGCSPECGIQARSDGADLLPFFGWTAQFKPEGFPPRINARSTTGSFRLLFASRVERDKGVFDLLQIAKRLREGGGRPVEVEICGDGEALVDLRAEVSRMGLEDTVTVRGRLSGTELADAYARCDAVIVPTRGDFCEGMPLVCAEAVLSGKPVVTSRLSNALPVLGPAIIEAEPENIDSYVQAVTTLANRPEVYHRLQLASDSVSAQFFDRTKSYAAAVDCMISVIHPGHSPLSDHRAVFL